MKKLVFSLLCVGAVGVYNAAAQRAVNDLKVVGAMKDVMWQGKLAGTINLDTLKSRENLYGFGPLAYLKGEVMIMDGKSYKSIVVNDTLMKVEETFDVQAPFFGYGHVKEWQEVQVSKDVRTIRDLEQLIIRVTTSWGNRPFLFKIEGSAEVATVHVVNLPKGTVVKTPLDAHKGRVDYTINNEDVEIIGFFSRDHKGIFTHLDSFTHMHLITKDKNKAGHLEDARFAAGKVKLYLPKP